MRSCEKQRLVGQTARDDRRRRGSDTRQRLRDDRELAAGEPADHVALGLDDAAQRGDVVLELEDASRELRSGSFEDLLLELVEPVLELLDLRPIAVDHRVDDAVHQGDRPFAEDAGVADADLADFADRPRHAGVHGDEVALPQEEVDVLRLERVLPRAEVDPVENQIQIVAV